MTANPTTLAGAAPPALPLAPAVPSLTYSGWRLSRLTEANGQMVYVADKEADSDHTHPPLRLVGAQVNDDAIVCEGYWPFRPAFAPRVLLGGSCLYTAAWAVNLSAAPNGAESRPLSLGLPGDLKRLVERINKGRTIRSVQLPIRPALYHRRLLYWQATVLQRFPSVECIRYTLPVHDYHGYILYLERALGFALPGLHTALDAYVQTLQAYLQQVWGDARAKIHFDIPGSTAQKQADLLSRENDFQLYLAAVQEKGVMGMEDLPEVALSHEVARRTGILIPCAVAVLGLPDPYMLRSDALCACQTIPLEALR